MPNYRELNTPENNLRSVIRNCEGNDHELIAKIYKVPIEKVKALWAEIQADQEDD